MSKNSASHGCAWFYRIKQIWKKLEQFYQRGRCQVPHQSLLPHHCHRHHRPPLLQDPLVINTLAYA